MKSSPIENRFISLYQAEPVLWDPLQSINRNKANREGAWTRISKKMGLSVWELKRMKQSLFSRFTYRLRRNQKMSQSGEKFEIYNPDWFITEPVDSFFGHLYQLRLGCKKASIKYPVNKVSGTKNDTELEKSADLKQEEECENLVSKYPSPLEKHLQKDPPKHVILPLERFEFNSSKDKERTKSDINTKNGSLKPLNLISSNQSSTQPNQSVPSVYRAPATNIEISERQIPFKTATPIRIDGSLKPLNLISKNHSCEPCQNIPSECRAPPTNIKVSVQQNLFKTSTSITIDSSLKPLNLISKNRSSQPSQCLPSECRAATTKIKMPVGSKPFKTMNDDCDLYSALLATKLRKLPEKDRRQLMYKIDSLLVGRDASSENYFTHVKPSAPTHVQNGYPYYPIVPFQFSSYFQQNILSSRSSHCSAFSIWPPK